MDEKKYCWVTTTLEDSFEAMRYRTSLRPGDVVTVLVGDGEEIGIVSDNDYKENISYKVPVMGKSYCASCIEKRTDYTSIKVPNCGEKALLDEIMMVEARTIAWDAINNKDWIAAATVIDFLKDKGEDISEFSPYLADMAAATIEKKHQIKKILSDLLDEDEKENLQ